MGTEITPLTGVIIDEKGHKMNIVSFKAGMTVLIWACCFFGVLPKLIPAIGNSPNALSFMNCFSGGIFIGMAFIHIIPEGVE